MSRPWHPIHYALSVAMLSAAIGVYWPGLSGTFLLDDHANLIALDAIPPAPEIADVVDYLRDDIGHAGRPLARLAFLPNRADWPDNARAFKLINLLIHCVNGALLLWLLNSLLATGRFSQPDLVPWLALAATALWLWHPLNTSTVLYPIQRATQLAFAFTALGLTLYLIGRRRCAQGKGWGYPLMSLGAVVGTILAALCKETGILFPLYVLAVEYTLLQSLPRGPGWRIWAVVFLSPPLVFIAAWHIDNYDWVLSGYAYRDYTLGERVLTQLRVLAAYLVDILAPVRTGTGLFHDDTAISTGLLSPPSTLVSLLLHLGLLSAALGARKRLPLFALAVFWFYAGHLLEASLIPLELYFEHRNYLPMVGPLLALSGYAIASRSPLRRFLRASFAAYLAIALLSAWTNAMLWGNPAESALVWYEEHPRSARATQNAANVWLGLGDYERALELLAHSASLRPGLASGEVQMLLVQCLAGRRIENRQLHGAVSRLRPDRPDRALVPALNNLIKARFNGRCAGIEVESLHEMLDHLITLSGNPKRSKHLSALYMLQAKVFQLSGRPAAAAESLAASFAKRPSVKTAIFESAAWANAGQFDKALKAVDKAEDLRRRRTGWLPVRSKGFSAWRGHLQDRARAE